MKPLLLTLLLASCGAKEVKPSIDHNNDLTEFLELKEEIREEIKLDQDEYGFIHSDVCDSMLYTGLIAAGGAKVDLRSAIAPSGQSFRTPYKDCYDNEQKPGYHTRKSKSDTAREHVLALMWGLNEQGDKESLNEIYEYGKRNKWIMGRGPYDRTYFTPNAQETLYILLEKSYQGIQTGWTSILKPHDKQGVAINIALRGEVVGEIDDKMLAVIDRFLEEDNENTLFHYIKHRYTDGDQSKTIQLAVSQAKEFPRGLNCVRWLWERDSKQWRGCSEKMHATRGWFLFLSRLLEKSQNI